jgi:hypothetical protein
MKLALLLCVLTGCVAPLEPQISAAPGVKPGWRPSYVVLYGLDPEAPPSIPAKGCEARGQVTVTTSEKTDESDALRRGAQDLGGNAVNNLRVLLRDGREVTTVGDVYRCPWPT